MRDALLTVFLSGLLPVALFRPFAGLLVFSWLAYFRPQDLAWSFARELPFSMMFAGAMVLGVVLGRVVGAPFSKNERLVRLDARSILLVLFWTALLLSTIHAVDPGVARGRFLEVSKVLAAALLTTGLCRNRQRVRWLLIVIAASFGLLALKHGVFAVRTGEFRILKGPGGMIGDNNELGLALVMGLPLLFYLALTERIAAAKFGALFLSAWTVATVFFTRSRGGLLALAVIAVAWMLKFRNRAWALVVGPVLLVATVAMVPPELVERVRGVVTGRPDASAMLRLTAWEKAVGMARDHPLYGVGPGNFEKLWHAYPPAIDHAPLSAHNTYLQILVESGGLGLALYAGLLAAAMAGLAGLRGGRPPGLVCSYSHALELSLAGFMVGAIFLTRGHFDLVYQLVALVTALRLAEPGGETIEELLFFWRSGEGPAYPRPGLAADA